jgi:two-component system phosphate regulon response regulator PhoB
MGTLAESMIEKAVKSLLERSAGRHGEIFKNEEDVNNLHIEMDERVINVLALQHPVAADLRLVVMCSKIAGELERIGDQAVNICQNTESLLRYPPLKPLIDIPLMAEIARRMLRESLDAFVRQDAALAQKVLDADDEVDAFKEQIFRELLTYMMSDPATIPRALPLILISRNLERVGDHAPPSRKKSSTRPRVGTSDIITRRKGAKRAKESSKSPQRNEEHREEHFERNPEEPRRLKGNLCELFVSGVILMTQTILIIDDEPELIKLLDYNLTKSGYLAVSARDGATGLDMARKHRPDLIILDVMMPGMDGWEVCKKLRQDSATASTPLLMLTAKAEEADRVLGLELGADDYVTKPFGVREILARVKALLRRAQASQEPSEVIKAGKLVIDSGRRTITIAGKRVDFSTTEFNLLRALAARQGRVLSREELIADARGDDVEILDRTVDVHVAAVRRKLGKHGDLIETVRGVGYRLKE